MRSYFTHRFEMPSAVMPTIETVVAIAPLCSPACLLWRRCCRRSDPRSLDNEMTRIGLRPRTRIVEESKRPPIGAFLLVRYPCRRFVYD